MDKDINALFSIFDMQKNFASTSSDFTVKNIKTKLIHLYDVFKKYQKEILVYAHQKYNKPLWDTYKSDIVLIEKEIKFFIRNARKFVTLKNIEPFYKQPVFHRNYAIHKPYGCCLMLFNDFFPLSKVFVPIIGALASGNTLFIKLPNYESQINKIIKSIFKEVFNDNFVYFINETILEHDLKNILDFNFDLVFYSGNSANSKNIVRVFSAKNIKVILDINNKCPVIVDETADLANTARQIVWSKMFCAGQTSYSPYYLIMHESIVKSLISHLKVEYEKQFPKHIRSKMITKVDTKKNFENINNSLNKALQKNQVIFGGNIDKDTEKIDLTLIAIDDLKSVLLTNDVSSSILPVVIFNTFSDVNGIVKHNDTPSAIFFFSRNKKRIKTLMNSLESRYFYVNDITMPFLKNLWFGGVRNSGTDLYGKKESINLFAYKRVVIKGSSKLNSSRFSDYFKKEERIKKKLKIG